jgi:hypothetical protein
MVAHGDGWLREMGGSGIWVAQGDGWLREMCGSGR